MEVRINSDVIAFFTGLGISIVGFLTFIFRIKKVTYDQIQINKNKIIMLEKNISKQNEIVMQSLRLILRKINDEQDKEIEQLEKEIDKYLLSFAKKDE